MPIFTAVFMIFCGPLPSDWVMSMKAVLIDCSVAVSRLIAEP